MTETIWMKYLVKVLLLYIFHIYVNTMGIWLAGLRQMIENISQDNQSNRVKSEPMIT
jgi:hypothetical protein